MAYVGEGVRISLENLMRNDLALAGASALVVLGLLFNMFAVVVYTFRLDSDMAFICGLMGSGLWVIAAAVFAFFLSGQQPRHSRRR